MRGVLRTVTLALVMTLLVAGCTALTGKTAGENVDDATITAGVKAKLAVEKASTLMKIDVDTNKGTVYLNGNVDSGAMKERAEDLARQVKGVKDVVNNLKLQASR
jgi:hyperosmotically inducible periplasmic protein